MNFLNRTRRVEKATREFLEEDAVRKKLDNVRLKLMKIAEADEPEPEQ